MTNLISPKDREFIKASAANALMFILDGRNALLETDLSYIQEVIVVEDQNYPVLHNKQARWDIILALKTMLQVTYLTSLIFQLLPSLNSYEIYVAYRSRPYFLFCILIFNVFRIFGLVNLSSTNALDGAVGSTSFPRRRFEQTLCQRRIRRINLFHSLINFLVP